MTDLAERHRRPLPFSFSDACKRTFLGKPMITSDLQHEKLSNGVALGALSPRCDLVRRPYGPEQIMVELLPAAGMAAFVLLLPITGVILVILALVSASYRQVVMTYTRAGGSYVVARENFGPRVAQVAAAALLIDYVVTVAIQCAAGTVAVASAIPTLGPYSLEITVAAVLVFCFANLRGLREAGRTFAVPTYAFIFMLTLMVVAGIVREIVWTLPVYDPQHLDGAVPVQQGNGLVMGADDSGTTSGVRQRRLIADRSRGNFQHCQSLSRAAGHQRAACSDHDGLDSWLPVGWGRLACLRHPRHSLCRWISLDAF